MRVIETVTREVVVDARCNCCHILKSQYYSGSWFKNDSSSDRIDLCQSCFETLVPKIPNDAGRLGNITHKFLTPTDKDGFDD